MTAGWVVDGDGGKVLFERALGGSEKRHRGESGQDDVRCTTRTYRRNSIRTVLVHSLHVIRPLPLCRPWQLPITEPEEQQIPPLATGYPGRTDIRQLDIPTTLRRPTCFDSPQVTVRSTSCSTPQHPDLVLPKRSPSPFRQLINQAQQPLFGASIHRLATRFIACFSPDPGSRRARPVSYAKVDRDRVQCSAHMN
jgi:hypothetical protein